LGKGDDDGGRGVPVEFIGKSQRGEADEGRVARISTSKGFKAAREMVYEALQRRATDIHLEPTKQEMTVRYRIDGILHATDPFSRAMGDAVLNIFKVLANPGHPREAKAARWQPVRGPRWPHHRFPGGYRGQRGR